MLRCSQTAYLKPNQGTTNFDGMQRQAMVTGTPSKGNATHAL